MGRTYTDEQRRRHAASHMARRVERETARRIVPITERPLDDGIVDHVAVELALRGWRGHAIALRRAELVEAIRLGTAQGLSGPELADLLCLWEREVTRLRAEARELQELAA